MSVPDPLAFWSQSEAAVLAQLGTTRDGLSAAAATARLRRDGPNTLQTHRRQTPLVLLLNQFKSPLVLILVFAAAISLFAREWADATIVLCVVFGSTLLGFFQEFRASNAVEKLRSQITVKSTVLREGQPQLLPAEQLVAGDIVLLSAGSLIPADGIVVSANELQVNQAVLTGETFPVRKQPGAVEATAGLALRTNMVFMGTSVASGTATIALVQTGTATVFGQIAERLSLTPPETEFERGIQHFGYLLTQVMVAMVVLVLAINIFLKKPPIDSLLFALALAVGLTPELLPAIISITLSSGAQRMAQRGVIVRRLNAIENFGSMDTLCTDKTGTLTEGVIHLDGARDQTGAPSEAVLRAALLNAQFQQGLANPLDSAIVTAATMAGVTIGAAQRAGEIPYDFIRKRLSVLIEEEDGQRRLVTKGALEPILTCCQALPEAERAAIDQQFQTWSDQGFRVLGVAHKPIPAHQSQITAADEAGLTFLGFLLFLDPPKAGVREVIGELAQRGVTIKLITGDNARVAQHIASAVGLPGAGILTGSQLNDLRDEALWHLAETTTIFAEVDPNQKERIILALRKRKHVVGYMGDGINDAPALHAADVGISVDTAVDVAKEAADFVLLQRDLGVLRQGIDEGRVTFANTLKYILTTISANFGNMFSMAGASLFLPFLPLLAPQILLNNFLSDIPATTIASDRVDPEWVMTPHRWDTRFIRNYMVLFGLVSSIFDFLTFGTLLWIFRAAAPEFRTGWFIESLLTELVIALVVRTRLLFFQSRPSNLLLLSTGVVVALTLILPYLPFRHVFGFVALPLPLLATVVGLTLLYVVVAELAKHYFYRRLITTPGPTS